MKFKFSKKTLLFPILFLSIPLSAQETYIPYRDGKLWGVSNFDGTEIIAPKFDSISFNEQDDYDFKLIHTFKNKKRGIILDGKEALSPEYKNIFPSYRGYIVAEVDDEKKHRMIIDKSGAKITEQPVLSILDSESFGNGYSDDTYNTLFHTLNDNMREDLFVWNPKEQKVNSIYKDYYSIALRDNKKSRKLDLTYRKNESDPLSEATFISDGKTIVPYTSKNSREMIVKYTPERGSSYYGGYQEGIKTSRYGSSETYSESVTYTPPPPPPSTGRRSSDEVRVYEPATKTPSYVNVSYSLENDFPKIIYSYGYQKDAKKFTKRLKLPRKITHLKIETFKGNYPQRKTADTIYTYNNYISYLNKNKKEILITENKPTEYDSIKMLSPSRDSGYQGVLFLLGQKKNGKMKFSFMNGNQQFSATDFDELIVNEVFGSSDYSFWTIKKDGKYGVINPKGEFILKPIYDEIINKKTDNGYGNYLRLKKDGKYGFLKPSLTAPTLEVNFIEPIYDYPIRNIYLQYPYWQSVYSPLSGRNRQTGTILVALEDEKGKLLGYANKNGQLYFKN
ncbi:WG repeat-containing protein [Chryseobacterium sp. MMS23-Vi53]|uniref:WG repeat-containing protein n=1 Tax=Chryseobacterium sp. MMS23-Vi53 TaxID=3386644 RepID=UPI0039EAFADC